MNPPTLQQVCAQFRRRTRARLLQLGACRLALIWGGGLALAVAADWLVRFAPAGRWVLLALLACLVAEGVYWLLRNIRLKWNDLQVLTYLDALDPQSRDGLVALFEMARPERISESGSAEGREMQAHAVAQLAAQARQFRLDDAFAPRGLRRWRRGVLALSILAVGAGVLFHRQAPIALERIFLPWTAVKWPTRTTLEVVKPANGWRIPQGEDFHLATRVTGQRPPQVEVVYKSRSTDYWITERVSVDDSGTANYTFPAVGEPVVFYVRGGDDRTDKFTIDVSERPGIKKIVAYYAYPDYAGLANRQIESGQVRGLEGTQVKLDFETTVPIRSAVFALEGKPEETLALSDATHFSKTLTLETSGQYTLKLTDPNGFREYKPERYTIQVTPVNPPEVRWLAPGRDIVATPRVSLKFVFEARDDFSLRRVAFYYTLGAGGKPQALSDKITGPIPQTGKLSRGEFTWDFSKEGLTHNTEVEYWVTAADGNPTGRGVTESPHFKVSLLTPTDFHNQILYEAKRVLAEARIAYRNQKKVYWAGRDWAAAGDNATEEQWNQIVELQDAANRAGDAIGRWSQELKEHIDRNHMPDAFMESRLVRIEDLRRGAAEQQALAAKLLADTNPRNSAEALPLRLRTARLAALRQAAPGQELAAVGLGRLLRQMYDWENLQTALVNTTLLRERQEEIYELTRQTAPQTIGREAQDLDDKTVDFILNLAQRQKAAMETETNLENQLAAIALKADAEGRTTTKRYLLVAYGYLRDIRVNNKLKVVAGKIADNQLADVAQDQLGVMTALNVVEGGLLAAGKNADGDAALAAADLLKREQEDVETARVQTPAATEPSDDGMAQVNPAAIKKLLDEVVPVGEDAFSQSLQALAEGQDDIRSLTRYLAQSLSPQDMPRYRRLEMGLLRYRQKQLAGFAADKIGPLVEKSEFKQRLKSWFSSLAGQLQALQTLLETDNLSDATRRIQDDLIETSSDLTQFLARQKRVRDLAAEHARRGGVDEFNRPYLLQGDDLAGTLDLYQQIDWARTVQAGVNRKSDWLKAEKDKAQAPLEIQQKVREETAAQQDAIARQLADAKAKGQGLRGPAKAEWERAGLPQIADRGLAEAAEKLRQLLVDPAMRSQQDQALEQMRLTLNRVKELLDEPVTVAVAPVATEPSELVERPGAGTPGGPAASQSAPVFYTEEDLARLTTPQAIRSALESTSRLPPEFKERLLQNLPQTFPEKYRRLVGAYYRDLLEKRPDEPKGGNP